LTSSVRFNGPNKMNTISQGFQKEAEEIILKNVVGNKDIKAIVFISSKPDNFIAGADIDMVTPSSSPLIRTSTHPTDQIL
jgi:enoyl-CoA hydratase/carnithine racemase